MIDRERCEITRRDRFAESAMKMLIRVAGHLPVESLTMQAYVVADNMEKARAAVPKASVPLQLSTTQETPK